MPHYPAPALAYRPARVAMRGPYALHEASGGTAFVYPGELGTDLLALGR